MATPVTGIRIPEDVLDRAKYIAWFDRSSFSERTLELIRDDIAKWEKKNGAITEEQIKKIKAKK